MESDFQQRMDALIAEYERKMKDLEGQKDHEREVLRSEMQITIDELLQRIEDEK